MYNNLRCPTNVWHLLYITYWSKVLTDQQILCRFFRKHKIVKNLQTATIKQVIIHLSNLLKCFFQKSYYVIFFGQKKWKVPYPNTRLQLHNCWLFCVLDIQEHTFFHWFWRGARWLSGSLKTTNQPNPLVLNRKKCWVASLWVLFVLRFISDNVFIKG